MLTKNKYTSVGINQTPSALDWGFNGLICYGAANALAIQDPSLSGESPVRTFAGHADRVNTVKWVQRGSKEPEFELVSGSDDGKCIYWDIRQEKKLFLTGHEGGITSVDAIYADKEITAVTSSSDSTVRLWRFTPESEKDETSVNFFQLLNLNGGLCFAVKLCFLPDRTALLLTYATDDDNIHFYGENYSQCFERVEVLKSCHEDWIRSLDFTKDVNGDLLLASASQDSFIRLWRISSKNLEANKDFSTNENLIQVEERTFQVSGSTFIISLESVLQGHENWVYSVNWSRSSDSLQLLSSSMDKTMIIWSFDSEQQLWTEKIRVGDVGGNSLGFYGAKFNGNGKAIIGHGYLGSLHLWKENEVKVKLWEPGVIVGGHYKEVRDIEWEPRGKYLFSVSTDQTTRIHALWNGNGTYHEIARPQVHGYDMQCLAVISRYKFASAAEEKIIRTFQGPGNFVENFRKLVDDDDYDDSEGESILESHQKGASVPSLGLSNKAVYEEDLINPKVEEKKFKDEYPENYFVPLIMKEPPTEEYLTQNTLWPELQKLYAHGYELYSLAATRNGRILASACKATTFEHSEIILWDTNTWKIMQRLRSHKLTVTQMKFSSDGSRLLSVGRDRRWTMFENKAIRDGGINFEVVASTDRQNAVHERVIWCCGWTHDDCFFATGSRDAKVAVWEKSASSQDSSLKEYLNVSTLELQESVTAIAFAKSLHGNGYLLAIGLESGIIQLYNFKKSSFLLLKTMNHSEAHHSSVNKLEFRPNFAKFQLASCSNDHCVKIYDVLDF